jgi:hypothetical protein
MKTTTAVGIMGSVVINLMLGIVIAAVFSVTPTAQAREVVQCPAQHTEHPASQPALEHGRSGGHLVAVRMGWEAG